MEGHDCTIKECDRAIEDRKTWELRDKSETQPKNKNQTGQV